FTGREEADRGNAEVLENLGAEANLAPLARTGRIGDAGTIVRNFQHGNASSAVAQIDDDAATSCLKTFKGCADRLGATKNVANDVSPVQPRQDVFAVAYLAVDKCHVMHPVKGRHIGVALKLSDL